MALGQHQAGKEVQILAGLGLRWDHVPDSRFLVMAARLARKPSDARESNRTLLGDEELERSSVVANCRMNRQRTLTGSNGYAKELGLHPLDLMRRTTGDRMRWLDLCCGEGKALVEAARIVHEEGAAENVEIVGLDLVAPPTPLGPKLSCLQFVRESLVRWEPVGQFDLITCVHGLHYVGDKLGLIARAVRWLTAEGQFVANLDLGNIKLVDGRAATRIVAGELRRAGLQYDRRRHLLRCPCRMEVRLPFQYRGADDQAGPNYTKQPAVDSYYELLSSQPNDKPETPS
jgi:SAM-dependent methyltransferase